VALGHAVQAGQGDREFAGIEPGAPHPAPRLRGATVQDVMVNPGLSQIPPKNVGRIVERGEDGRLFAALQDVADVLNIFNARSHRWWRQEGIGSP